MVGSELYREASQISNSLITNSPEAAQASNWDVLEMVLGEIYQLQRAIGQFPERDQRFIPGNLPAVGDLIFPETESPPGEFSVVSVCGMPHAGKTGSIGSYLASHPDYHYSGEAYPAALNDLGKQEISAGDFEILKTGYEREFITRLLQMDQGLIPKTPVIVERAVDSIVFRRMLLLKGLACFNQPLLSLKFDIEHMSGAFDLDTLIVLCLITPKDAISRGSKLSEADLERLYLQYLRLHYELTHYRQIFGQPLPVTYCCLDCTGSPADNSVLLSRTVDTFLSRNKQVKSE